MTTDAEANETHQGLKSEALPTADVLAQPRKRIMLPVSFGQWDRLKSRVGVLGNPRVDYVNYVVGAWGISIPCALSFLVFVFQKDRSTWAVSLYGAAALAAGAIALILKQFQRDEADIRRVDASDIVGEMTSIEEAYLRGETTR